MTPGKTLVGLRPLDPLAASALRLLLESSWPFSSCLQQVRLWSRL